MHRWLPLPTAALIVAALAACGSSEPGYCGDRDALRDSADQLSTVDVRADGVGAVRSQLRAIRADADTAIASAKGDFPDQTQQIRSSVDGLKTAVDEVPSSPSAADIAKVSIAVAATVQAVKAFDDATADAC